MDIVVKREKIVSCILGPSTGGWMYKIICLQNNATYKAELWGYNDDHGYLAQFTIQESSPEFATAEEAEAFAQREWIIV